MKKNKWLFLVIILIFLIIGSFQIFGNEDKKNNKTNKISQKSSKKVYEHTFPQVVTKNDYYKGEFILNNIASIYPRRDAIVKDILVDIGDEVKAGDTLAILFEPGISGEASSKINIKNTLVSTKNNLLSDIVSVKNAKISEIDTKINEKKVIISETTKTFDIKISQLDSLVINKNTSEEFSVENANNQITIEEKNLETLSKNLENAKLSRIEKLNDSKNNISQKEELLDTKIEESFYNIIPIFYIGNEKDIDYLDIDKNDLADVFGALNTSIKNELLSKTNSFQNNKNSLSTTKKYNELVNINNLLIETLKNTIISVDSSEQTITGYITSLNSYNNILISHKENYDDSLNGYSILEKNEEEKIGNLEYQIEKQKEVIIMRKSSYDIVKSGKNEKIENLVLELLKVKTEKSLQVNKLNAELETLKSSRGLLIANENKNITSIQNDVALAKSELNNEYIKSSDYTIISPFSGKISKRTLEIGEKISQNMEAFRITGVETTLSRVAKQEVKFYVPENMGESLELGKLISFSLGDSTKTYTGAIYRISPEIDEKTFSITVQAKVDDNISLPNKSTLRIKLENKKNIYKIPSSTIYNKNERKIIYYKKDNGKLGVKDINIISDDGEFSLVSGDFDENLKVVTTAIFVK